MKNIVTTSQLSKLYGKIHALTDMSVSINEHSITGLIGRNGSGKTTLMRIIAGRLDNSSGDVHVFGEKPMDNINVLNQLVYTYHNMPFDADLNLKTILLGYKIMFPSFDAAFADKLLRYFELTPNMKYKSLSQGQGSIFNFLSALACRIPLTMFDEPVLGMDVTVRKSAYDILLRDFTEHPRTMIISSHLLSELEGLLSDILLIDSGKVVFHQAIDEVRLSAYRIDGAQEAITHYIIGKKVIEHKTGGLNDYAIIHEPCTETVINEAKKQGLTVTAVRPEALCVYLTQQQKEAELACLW